MTDAEKTPAANHTGPAPEKVDPETFALRARPRRAIRFKRGAIVGIAAFGSFGLVATTWVALKPGSFTLVSPSDNRDIVGKAPTEALAALPRGYGDVPKLGPPLPGDLGRPILAHQRAMATEDGAVPGHNDIANRAAAERERVAAEHKSARESGVLVQTSGTNASVSSLAQTAPLPPLAEQNVRSGPAIDLSRDPNGQRRKIDFVNTDDRHSGINPHRLTPAASGYTISAGSVISASLITGLRSDLPGLVVAQITEQSFDSATGQTVLIPQGARLIGSYDSVVAFGQRRALIAWQRLIMPDGSSITLDNVPATDASGYSGLADKVDFHTWTLLKGVAISTLLGVGSNLTFGGESDLVQAIRQSTQQNVARAGDQLTSRNLQVQPTITIRPGAIVKLVVHRDLVLAPSANRENLPWQR